MHKNEKPGNYPDFSVSKSYGNLKQTAMNEWQKTARYSTWATRSTHQVMRNQIPIEVEGIEPSNPFQNG